MSTTVDLRGIEKMFSGEAMRSKQAAFAKRVEFETRDYVPLDEGTLRDSTLGSDYEDGFIEWDTPYAQAVHAMPEEWIKKTKNPDAHAKWHEKAKEDRLEAWKEFARSLFK